MPSGDDNLPDDPSSGARGGSPRAIYIDSLHYHPNDLTEIRRIAESNPDLAMSIVDGNREANQLATGSYRLGLIVAGGLACLLVSGFVFVAVKVGFLAALGYIAVILASGHFLRVALTGEWSDTSWVGRILDVLGARKKE